MEKKLIPFILILLLFSLFFNFYLFSKWWNIFDKGSNTNLNSVNQNQSDDTITSNSNWVLEFSEWNLGWIWEISKPTISEEDFFKLDVPEDFTFNNSSLEVFYNSITNNKEFFDENQDEYLYFEIFKSYLFWKQPSDSSFNELIKCFNGEEYNLSWDLEQLCEGENKYVKEYDLNYFHEKDFFISLKKVVDDNGFQCNYFLDKWYNYPKDQILWVKISDYFSCKSMENKKFDLKKQYFLFQEASKYEKCDILDDKNLSSLCKEFSYSVSKLNLSDDTNF